MKIPQRRHGGTLFIYLHVFFMLEEVGSGHVYYNFNGLGQMFGTDLWILLRDSRSEVSENQRQSHEFGPCGLSATFCDGPLILNLRLIHAHGGVKLTSTCI